MTSSLPLACLFGAAALFSIVELLRSIRAEVASYIADREAHATHVLMNGGMAAMLAPFYDADIGRAIVVVYSAAIVVLIIDAIVRRGPSPGLAGGRIYHVIGLAAMVWAIRQMPGPMLGMAMSAGAASWPALALTALFLLDGAATAGLVVFAPRTMLRMADALALSRSPRLSDVRAIREVRVAAVPHCLMDAGMVLMLWPLT